jgi:hypothetical protein
MITLVFTLQYDYKYETDFYDKMIQYAGNFYIKEEAFWLARQNFPDRSKKSIYSVHPPVPIHKCI